jgi:precorrin-8X/cobalt-precorrin-8 methylmutase
VQQFDHPIFIESITRIQAWLGNTGLGNGEQEVLTRLVHSSGDLGLAPLLRFSAGVCDLAMAALAKQAVILTDTSMAAAAVAPMAARTFGNPVHSMLDWAPAQAAADETRSALGIELALQAHPQALVLIGSAPTALMRLLEIGASPICVIGMPVGFVGVKESKNALARSGLAQIRLEGSRGGAGLVAATVNALLRRAWLTKQPN